MSTDPQLLEQFLERLCDRYTASELVMHLEDAEMLTVHDIVNLFKDELIELRSVLEQ